MTAEPSQTVAGGRAQRRPPDLGTVWSSTPQVVAGGLGGQGTYDWGGYINTPYFADPTEGAVGALMEQTQETTVNDTGWKFRLLVGQAIDDEST